jgi:hypothetical protein
VITSHPAGLQGSWGSEASRDNFNLVPSRVSLINLYLIVIDLNEFLSNVIEYVDVRRRRTTTK